MNKNIHFGELIILLLIFFSACTTNEKKAVEQQSYNIVVLEGPTRVGFESMLDQSVKLPVATYSEIYDNPLQIQTLMLQNKPDVAVIPTTMAANLYNKGVDYVPLGCAIWGNLYLVSSDSTIKTSTDLRNKEIYLFNKGLQPDLLAKIRFNPYNVKFNYKYDSHLELASAIAGGVVSTAVLPEPFVSRAMQANPDIRIIDEVNFMHNGRRIPQTLIMIKRSLIPCKKVIEDYIYQVIDASINNNSLPAMTVKRCNIRFSPIDSCKEDIQFYLGSMYGYNPKLIGNKFPDNDFYNWTTKPVNPQ
ncbi:MAG: hypothetical protein ACRC77_06720 [Bacteroidales bacterium]